MKKLIALLLCCVLCAVGLIGCSETNQGSSDPVQVDVRIYKAGYGTDWFKAAAAKFQELYKDQKYTINIVEESSSVAEKVLSEIQNKKTNTIDLYITGDTNFSNYLKYSKSALKSTDEVLLENLNDVFASKAIRFDGSEESVTIDEKLNDSVKYLLKYAGTESTTYAYLNKFKDNYYAFPWASGVSGFTINKSVFERFGLELPRTTDELLAAYDAICPKNGSGTPTPAVSGIYPMIYGGKNAAGFWLFVYDTMFAQYSGAEAEKNFWLCKPLTGTMANNGYDVYDDQGILEALKVVEKLCDENYCMNGTANMDEISAQLQLLQGNAAVMPTGNWVYNEMKLNFPTVVDNGCMMKMPVISALGTKLGISDSKLSSIIKGVDEGKTDAQIASECSTTTDIAARVRQARSVYFDYSVNHIALIPSYSESKNVAKLFLRFLASDDNLDLYKNTAYSSLPFRYAGESKASTNAFVKSVDEIMGYGNNTLVCEDLCTSPIRQVGLHCFPAYGSYENVFKGLSQKEFTAQTVYNKNKASAEDDWSTLKSQAGVN